MDSMLHQDLIALKFEFINSPQMSDGNQIHAGFSLALKFFGSQVAIARAAGVTPQYINACRAKGFSAETALRLERASRGSLSAIALVRDIDGTGADTSGGHDLHA